MTMLEDLQHVGVAFVSLGEGIDCTTPAGKLQLHILAALAEFERERIRERIHAGIARARREGKRLGRRPHRVTDNDLTRTAHLSQHEAAKVIGVPRSVLQRARAAEMVSDGTRLSPRIHWRCRRHSRLPVKNWLRADPTSHRYNARQSGGAIRRSHVPSIRG